MIMLRMSPILCLMQAEAHFCDKFSEDFQKIICPKIYAKAHPKKEKAADVHAEAEAEPEEIFAYESSSGEESSSEAQANDFQEPLRRLAPPVGPVQSRELTEPEKKELEKLKKDLEHQVDLIKNDSALKESLVKEILIKEKEKLIKEKEKELWEEENIDLVAETLAKLEFKDTHQWHLFNLMRIGSNESGHRLLAYSGSSFGSARAQFDDKGEKFKTALDKKRAELEDDQKEKEKLKKEVEKYVAEQIARSDFKESVSVSNDTVKEAQESAARKIAYEYQRTYNLYPLAPQS